MNQYNKNKDDLINSHLNEDLKGFKDIYLDWIYIKDNFIKIELSSYPGTTNIQKFELFLANYLTNDFVHLS